MLARDYRNAVQSSLVGYMGRNMRFTLLIFVRARAFVIVSVSIAKLCLSILALYFERNQRDEGGPWP